MELIAGATGYVGRVLTERLLVEGRGLRALVRDPARMPALPGLEILQADLLEDDGLEPALDGCTSAYYLVHSMERPDDSGSEDFIARDRRAAERFGNAARAVGLERIVYLGGFAPPEGTVHSPHLASRLEVESILLEAAPASTALRASILIGAGSSSFRMLVRLVEELRVLPMPAWKSNRTQPIDERDAIEYLVRAPLTPEAAGRVLDIAGPDVLSYGEMIERIAESMGVSRAGLRLPLTQTPAASAIVAAVTGAPVELVRPLMESLETELLPRDDAAQQIFGLRLHTYESAVERALHEWEKSEPLAAR